jgi:hypothetical protein
MPLSVALFYAATTRSEKFHSRAVWNRKSEFVYVKGVELGLLIMESFNRIRIIICFQKEKRVGSKIVYGLVATIGVSISKIECLPIAFAFGSPSRVRQFRL